MSLLLFLSLLHCSYYNILLIKRRGCILYVIIPMTNLVCVLFDPVIPTLSFNFIQLFFILVAFIFFRKEIACCPMLVCTACVDYWLATVRCHNYCIRGGGGIIIFINFMHACIIIAQLRML